MPPPRCSGFTNRSSTQAPGRHWKVEKVVYQSTKPTGCGWPPPAPPPVSAIAASATGRSPNSASLSCSSLPTNSSLSRS